jgi:hypothetical protein
VNVTSPCDLCCAYLCHGFDGDPALFQAEAFAAHGYAIHRAPSDWVVDRRARAFTRAIADGHATAALGWERRGADAILDWLDIRQDQADAGQLAVRIGHQDFLALPPAR